MNNPFETIEARLNNIESLLLNLKRHPQEQTEKQEQDQLFTVEETADFLKLSTATIYTLISKGELPVMKRSKRCYFSKLDLMNYLKEGRRKTISELSNLADNKTTKRK